MQKAEIEDDQTEYMALDIIDYEKQKEYYSHFNN
jgi:hypothetical protein